MSNKYKAKLEALAVIAAQQQKQTEWNRLRSVLTRPGLVLQPMNRVEWIDEPSKPARTYWKISGANLLATGGVLFACTHEKVRCFTVSSAPQSIGWRPSYTVEFVGGWPARQPEESSWWLFLSGPWNYEFCITQDRRVLEDHLVRTAM